MMTITLTPTIEARLREMAQRDGSNVNAVAKALIVTALEWEAQERAETIEAVRRSDQAAIDGRERPLSLFLAEQRAKHGFDLGWPQEDDHAV